MHLADYVVHSARDYPDKTALLGLDEEINYRELGKLVLSCGKGLKALGLNRGDRVAILLNNSIPYVAAYFGALSAGLVAVPLSPDMTHQWLSYVLKDCDVKAVIYDARITAMIGKVIQALDHPPHTIAVEGESMDNGTLDSGFKWTDFIFSHSGASAFSIQESDSLGVILYTSGTTGKPKGVMLTHENLIANTESIISYLRLQSNDRIMAVLPFYYFYGNSLLLTHMAVSGSVVIDNRFAYPNAVLKKIQDSGATGFAGVPSTFAFLLHKSTFRKMKFPSLRYITQAGGAMSPAMIQDVKSVLPRIKIYIMYGQTEASARLSYLEPDYLLEKLGSIGKAIPGVKLSLIKEDGLPASSGEVGEIVAEGKNIMKGYWRDEAETKKVLRDGRLFTGDLAWKDEDDFLFIVGRKKEIIKSAAYRISPKEIEDVIMESDLIAEVAVIGVEDPLLGEAIKACVVPKIGLNVKPEDIISHCKTCLASYKIPKYVQFCESLPKTRSGKIRKGELKDQKVTAGQSAT